LRVSEEIMYSLYLREAAGLKISALLE